MKSSFLSEKLIIEEISQASQSIKTAIRGLSIGSLIKTIQGTMNLENQQLDSRFIEELVKQEEERLLHGPNARLWEDNI